jgi:hypothetical protein
MPAGRSTIVSVPEGVLVLQEAKQHSPAVIAGSDATLGSSPRACVAIPWTVRTGEIAASLRSSQ